MRFFGFAHPDQCLDEEFDAPDAEAVYELCQAIVAGRAGLHPDGWGLHDPLTTLPPRFQEPFVPPVGYPGDNAVEWKPHKPQSKPKPKPGPQPIGWWIKDDVAGEIGLTCDDCNAKFRQTAQYGRGKRDAAAAMLRQMGRSEGWTHIVGRDRCPACSFIPPEPLDVDQRRVV